MKRFLDIEWSKEFPLFIWRPCRVLNEDRINAIPHF